MRNLLCWCSAIAIALSIAGCRFRVPSGAEGQHLRETGAFPGDVPAWVNQNKETLPSPSESAGFIPQARSEPRLSDRTAPEVNEELLRQEEQERRRPAAARPEADADESGEEGLGTVRTQEDDDINPAERRSPLARIDEACPGMEASALEAQETTNPSERIRKYSSLTLRCPGSPDLWLWLAKDYESQGRLAEAVRSYEKVLVLEPANKEAREQLTKVRERLNRPGGADEPGAH